MTGPSGVGVRKGPQHRAVTGPSGVSVRKGSDRAVRCEREEGQ